MEGIGPNDVVASWLVECDDTEEEVIQRFFVIVSFGNKSRFYSSVYVLVAVILLFLHCTTDAPRRVEDDTRE